MGSAPPFLLPPPVPEIVPMIPKKVTAAIGRRTAPTHTAEAVLRHFGIVPPSQSFSIPKGKSIGQRIFQIPVLGVALFLVITQLLSLSLYFEVFSLSDA